MGGAVTSTSRSSAIGTRWSTSRRCGASSTNRSMPRTSWPAHRIASLPKRWLLGTHQGAVGEEHIERFFAEFTFRFNRRHAKEKGFLFYRLLQLAVQREPITNQDLVSNPRPGHATNVAPTSRRQPPSLDRQVAGHPRRGQAKIDSDSMDSPGERGGVPSPAVPAEAVRVRTEPPRSPERFTPATTGRARREMLTCSSAGSQDWAERARRRRRRCGRPGSRAFALHRPARSGRASPARRRR